MDNFEAVEAAIDEALFEQAEHDLIRRLRQRWPMCADGHLIAGLYHPRSCFRAYLRTMLRTRPESFGAKHFHAVAALLDEDAAELWKIRCSRAGPKPLRRFRLMPRVGNKRKALTAAHRSASREAVDYGINDHALLAAIEEGEGHDAADFARYALSAMEDVALPFTERF